jgi:hypothetical protein
MDTQEQLSDLDKKQQDLEFLIKQKKERISRLADDYEAEHKIYQTKLQGKLAPGFKDVNLKHVLVGAKVEHKFSVLGMAEYFIMYPSAEWANEVTKFLNNPLNSKGETMAPVSDIERTVLLFMSGAQLKDREKESMPKGEQALRLNYIRQLPLVTLGRIADECDKYQALLDATLSLNLENF